MVERHLFARDLTGPSWDAVRAVRRELFANEGVPLSADVVTEPLEVLLPYASLLATGEEGARERFWEVMDAETREALLVAVLGRSAAIAEFLDVTSDEPSPERDAFIDLRNMCTRFDDEG